VKGAIPTITQNASVYLTDPNPAPRQSTIQLSESATLECDNDYYQDAGALETMDTTHCVLQDRADSSGTATIAGMGWLIIALPGGYGELDVNADTLRFAGTYSIGIAANMQGPGSCDLLQVTGTTNLLGSALTVNVNNGPPALGSNWKIIQDGVGKNIQNDFMKPITTNPQTNLNSGVNQKDKTQYLLSF
jgi:hypothetical protein